MNNNVNNTANQLANTIRNIQDSHKTKIGFVVVISIFLLVILILIIKRKINSNRMRNRLLKNTFFIEMEKGLKPYNAWCMNKSIDNIPNYITVPSDNNIYNYNCQSNNYVSDNNNDTISKDDSEYISEEGSSIDVNIPQQLTNKIKCQDLCIYGKNGYTNIPTRITTLDNSNHYVMFWFKINKTSNLDNYPFSKNDNKLSYEYPLIYFSKNNIIPNINKCNSFGFYIKPINNTLIVRKDGGSPLTTIYNLPYGKWICLTYLKSASSIDIYINGKLLKTIAINKNDYDDTFNKTIRWGPYPGDLAFLEINKDPNDLNPRSILDYYKYYNNLIIKYNKVKYDNITSSIKSINFPFRNTTEWSKMFKRGKSNSNLVCY